jgi:Mg-chelatase subunit ChlD
MPMEMPMQIASPLRACTFALLFVATPCGAQTASVKAAQSATVGSELEVRWTGPNGSGDFVSIDTAGSPDATYGPYAYPSAGNPLKVKVPDQPGRYEVRYHSGGSGYKVLAKAPLEVTDIAASLEAAASVPAGGTIQVKWKGPNGQGDFISIDAVGAPDRTYGNYAYPSKGNPLAVQAPDAAGDYVLRYHLGNSYRVLASRPLHVGTVGATLEFPAQANAGGTLAVKWTGPGHKGDFISIDKVGAADRTYGNYAYPEAAGRPVEIRVPDEPGDYLVRYHLASSYGVVGSAPLTVQAVTASLTAPAQVPARSVFAVSWKGPNNVDDFITIVVPTAKDGTYGSSNGYTQRGNPVRLEAPREPGNYELRYLTGQSYRTLGRAAIVVTPSGEPAKVRVVTNAKDEAAFGAVEFILDASGSMLKKLNGVRRIDIAKTALTGLAKDALPNGTGFALRVFGNREAGSCRTDLDIPLGPLDRTAAVARIQALQSMNLAKTPIGASLVEVANDLKGAKPPMLVVLVTDGEETCGGDPKAAIQALRAGGMDVRVNIVGFAVDEVVLKETFREWARLGNGGYFDAQNGEQLKGALVATLRPSYQLLVGTKVVASGTVNGDAVEVPAGKYRVRVLGATAKDVGEVTAEAGATRQLEY